MVKQLLTVALAFNTQRCLKFG